MSFGYKHGLPLDVDIVFDCRFLPNPHWVEALRPLTGLDAPVREYVLEQPGTGEFLDELDRLFDLLLPGYEQEGKAYLSIGVGCTGGRHRSVVIAEQLARRLERDRATRPRSTTATSPAADRQVREWRGPSRSAVVKPFATTTSQVLVGRKLSMAVRVGINGFGRIGRSFYRAILARGDQAGVELVAVNDPFGDAHTMAFLLKHDSVGGTIPNEVKETDGGFSVDGREIKKLEVREPAEIPWGDNGVDVVIESTGLFTAREKAAAPPRRAAPSASIISAPSGDADVMICLGVNDDVVRRRRSTR